MFYEAPIYKKRQFRGSNYVKHIHKEIVLLEIIDHIIFVSRDADKATVLLPHREKHLF
jgi:hypothetical protein